MIRVARTAVPDKLAADGPAETARAVEAVEGALARGEKPTYEWKGSLWGHKVVKGALCSMFHSKCAYCEWEGAAGSWPDVEHYRPKARVKEDPRTPEHGYYWLAYTWENLLLACPKCNRGSGKVDQFPIRGERARCPSDDLGAERPLLLDPTVDDPAEHLAFDTTTGEIAPKNGSPRGDGTIRVCGLDRQELDEGRRRRLKDLQRRERGYINAQRLGDPTEVEWWDKQIRSSMDASEEYSALARAYFDQT